jgi:tetratricopeptide (TPR) repeat protein
MSGFLDRKQVLRMLPFIALGMGVGIFTLYYEHHLVGAQGGHWMLTSGQRLIIAGRAFWFYLGKLFYPAPLVFIYPRWRVDPSSLAQFLYPALAVLFAGALAYGRKGWGKLPFAGLLFFAVTLSPMLGFTDFYFMRYAFVADHFQYLACMGILAWAGWGLAKGLNHLKIPETSPLGMIVIGMLCANLALASTRAARKFASPIKLWQETLAFNPDSAIAHHNLGIALSENGQWLEAIAHLRNAETLDPSFTQTHLALAYFAMRAKRWEDARREYQEAIRLGVRDPQILKDYASLPAPHTGSPR